MPFKLYDLVTKKGTGVFFSNNCSPVRLALLAKGVEFVTEEVEYPDLRFTWTPVLAKELGSEKATGAYSSPEPWAGRLERKLPQSGDADAFLARANPLPGPILSCSTVHRV